MKKKILLSSTLIALYICRTEVFNFFITYESQEQITITELTDAYWIAEVEKIIHSKSYNTLSEFNDQILHLISTKLHFNNQQIIKDPNSFRESAAHCVGYTSLHASMLQFYTKSNSYKVTHQRGNIYFLGFELTNLFNSQFFADHDYIKIENENSGEYYFSDASLYEFLRINRIGNIIN